MTFDLADRLKYALLAFLAGWLAGWLVTIPFVVAMAWRYVDAHASLLPDTVAKGLVIWGAFSLVMSLAGFALLVLPGCSAFLRAGLCAGAGFLIPVVTVVAILLFFLPHGLVERLLLPAPGDSLCTCSSARPMCTSLFSLR